MKPPLSGGRHLLQSSYGPHGLSGNPLGRRHGGNWLVGGGGLGLVVGAAGVARGRVTQGPERKFVPSWSCPRSSSCRRRRRCFGDRIPKP
jgi:hypothetical protein